MINALSSTYINTFEAAKSRESSKVFDKTEQQPQSTGKVWDKVDDFLDLGSSFDISLSGLSEKEKEQALKIIAKLIKEGIVGYRYYEIDGKIEKHFLVPSIGNRRLKRGIPLKKAEDARIYA